MPQPQDGEGGKEAPQENAFGEPLPGQEEAVQNPAPEGEGGNKEKQTPTQQIAELSRKLGEYEAKEKNWGEKEKEKDENIRAMREAIKRLEKQVGGGKKADEGGDREVLFKEIRTSKDLKAEEKEDMTETELKQFDEIAELKSGMNELFKGIKSIRGEKADEGDGGKTDHTQTAREHALSIAGGDKDIANQIIESYNEFNNDGLSEEQVKARIEKAAKLVPNYTPPKEQTKKPGSAVKGDGGSGTDPWGVDSIIKDVEESRKGGSYNL